MRYERKYRIESLPPAWVRQAILGHPASFRTLFPDRKVNNIYFDNPDLSGFYENAAGIPQRRKHRLRWYGETYENLPSPVFEVKIKDGELGRKEHQKLTSTDWPQLSSCLDQVPQLTYLPLQPVLVNSYHRSYLGSADRRFRITIDWGLSFAPFLWHQAPLHFHFLPDQAVIVELKYEQEDDDRAREIFRYLPFRQTKNSKYVTGINLVMG